MTAPLDPEREARLAQALRANLRRRKAGADHPGAAAPPDPAASRREASDGASGAGELYPDLPAGPSADPSAERSS